MRDSLTCDSSATLRTAAPARGRLRIAGRALLTLLLLVGVGATGAQAAADSGPMQALQSTHWIAEGSARPQHVLYVFVDANCPYCHQLWIALQPYYRDGLQVREVLVGIIGPSSPGKAAAILDSRDPSAAMRRNELQWGSRGDGGGGIAPLAQPGPADTEVLSHDLTLLQAFGFQGTPGIVYFDVQGRAHGADGLPSGPQLAQIVHVASAPLSASRAPARRAAESPR